MWWNYGHPMWGFWFIFPIMGFIFMIVMMVMVFQLFRRRGGMRGFAKNEEVENLRTEIRELKAEINALKK